MSQPSLNIVRLIPCRVAITACLLSLAPPGFGAAFRHPGILSNQQQLDFIRERVQKGVEPWRSAFKKMSESGSASLAYTPHPREVVTCGPYSKPDFGCSEEK